MNKKTNPLGISSKFGFDFTKEVFEEMKQKKIDTFEIAMTKKEMNPDFKKTVKEAAECGLFVPSYHLPFFPFSELNIATLNSELREKSVAFLSEKIKAAADCGIKTIVIHPSGEPNSDIDRPELIKSAKEALNALAEVAHGGGSVIAVEDLPRTCIGNSSKEMLSLLEANDKLRVCFDTNHLLFESPADFIRTLGDKIITLHVSDYDFLNERHFMPYEGKNDWVEIISELENIGYRGPIMYEVASLGGQSIDRRPLVFDDFYPNYLALIEKRAANPIGIPNEEYAKNTSFFKK